MIFIKPAFAMLAILLLCSCSPRQHDQRDVNRLPDYSDMSAAQDAGHTPAQPKTGDGK